MNTLFYCIRVRYVGEAGPLAPALGNILFYRENTLFLAFGLTIMKEKTSDVNGANVMEAVFTLI